jgi:hypothetical protein
VVKGHRKCREFNRMGIPEKSPSLDIVMGLQGVEEHIEREVRPMNRQAIARLLKPYTRVRPD